MSTVGTEAGDRAIVIIAGLHVSCFLSSREKIIRILG